MNAAAINTTFILALCGGSLIHILSMPLAEHAFSCTSTRRKPEGPRHFNVATLKTLDTTACG